MEKKTCLRTDGISQLPDEILLRILSLLPTKDVVITMVLSKRWMFLWSLVPRLVYDDSYKKIKYRRFSRFVDRSLFLHKAKVLESLYLKLGNDQLGNDRVARKCRSGDIPVWIKAAEKHEVRELIIEIDDGDKTSFTMPRSFYTCYKKLVTLKLSNAVLVDDSSSSISFPCLKILSLVYMKYPCDGFLNRLLEGCPLLEDLVVKQRPDASVAVLSVRALHLKSLVLHKQDDKCIDFAPGFVIDAPSLECLKIVDHREGFCIIENDLSKIVNAKIYLSHQYTEQLLSSLTTAKHLAFCLLTSKGYPHGSIFNNLVHLKLCTCETEWLNLLMCLLRDSPNLKVVSLNKAHVHSDPSPRPCWSEPSLVPECLVSSLETVEWTEYGGTEAEKQVVHFILRNGNCLKKVTIEPESTCERLTKLEMIKDLSFSPRASPACRLAFDFE